MRKFTILLWTLITLISCTSQKTKQSEKTIENPYNLKQNFPHILEGVWVLTDYINAINKTKSPVKSADKLKGVVTLYISHTNNTDTLEVGASWNNHEGYSFRTILEQGQKTNSLKTDLPDYDDESNYYNLGYEEIDRKIFLFLYHYNRSNKLINKIKFTKVKLKSIDNDLAEGLQLIVNQEIFSGTYLFFDSINTTTSVTFYSNGKISGHPDFKSYYIFTDFMGGPEPTIDEICMNFRKDNSQHFVFKSIKDTIFLYNTNRDELLEDEQLNFSELKYKLVKK